LIQKQLQPWQVIIGGMCGLVLTIGLARFAYTPLLPSLQTQTGLNDANAGVLAAINYAGYMSGAIAVAWIDDVRWRYWLYSAGLWMALITTALMAVAPSFGIWAVSRYVGGLCGAAGMLMGSGLVLGWLIRNGQRPELGLHFVGIGLGIVVSAIGAWGLSMYWTSWDQQWLAFACLGIIFLVPSWAWRPPVPDLDTKSSTSHFSEPAIPRRWFWTMFASYFAAGWGFVISATFTVTIVEREPLLFGLGPLAWAVVGIAAMPAVFIWDRIARSVGEKKALLLAFGLQTISVLMPAISGSMLAAMAGAIGYGATFIGIVSLTLAMVGRLSPNNPGKVMAKFTLGYGAAQMIAPVVAGFMAQSSGSFQGALWITAAVMTLGIAILTTL
jgi:MFS family permease